MHLKKFLFILMMVLFLPICATAEISLSYSFYNNQDDVSVGMVGDSLEFESLTNLGPNSFSYSNGGESTDPSAYYSYSISHNGNQLESGVSTDSGFFAWHAKASSDGFEDGGEDILAAKCGVVDGDITMYFRNPYAKHSEQISTTNAAYYESASITRDRIASSGIGSTIGRTSEDSDSSEDTSETSEPESIKGIDQTITTTQNQGKSASITTRLEGDTEFIWGNYAEAVQDDFVLGTRSIGLSDGSMDKIEMIGSATDFPTQILPPGDVEINVKYNTTGSSLPDDARIDDFFSYVDEEREDFIGSHEQTGSMMAFILRNMAFVNPYDDVRISIPEYYDEIYSMKMVFEVGE